MTASTGTVHTLTDSIVLDCLPIQLTRVLAAAIRMQDCSPEHWVGNHGVDGAIHRAAGRELLAERRTLGGCETGAAKITKGYRLPARYVIHTVGPVYSGSASDAELLRSCYWNSLELAWAHGLHTIAFPAISTGVYGYPKEAAAEIALMTIREWFDAHPDAGMRVTSVSFSAQDDAVYQNLQRELGES